MADRLPVPDPTVLTTEALMREIAHLRAIMDERDHRYEERYQAQVTALDAALAAADRNTFSALSAAEKAVQKAEIASEKRFDAVNDLSQLVREMIGSKTGSTATIYLALAAVGAMGTIIGLIAAAAAVVAR